MYTCVYAHTYVCISLKIFDFCNIPDEFRAFHPLCDFLFIFTFSIQKLIKQFKITQCGSSSSVLGQLMWWYTAVAAAEFMKSEQKSVFYFSSVFYLCFLLIYIRLLYFFFSVTFFGQLCTQGSRRFHIE